MSFLNVWYQRCSKFHQTQNNLFKNYFCQIFLASPASPCMPAVPTTKQNFIKLLDLNLRLKISSFHLQMTGWKKSPSKHQKSHLVKESRNQEQTGGAKQRKAELSKQLGADFCQTAMWKCVCVCVYILHIDQITRTKERQQNRLHADKIPLLSTSNVFLLLIIGF